jgi:2-(1,2-epoxy-1,2-dihydrophenyl)acetyl-CoA isomerase
VAAVDAARIGLVNKVVARAELDTEAGALARRLAQGPTKAIAAAKWLLNRSFESDRRTSFEEEALAQDLVVHSEDAGEGLAAFAERREPRFRGF